MADSTSSSSAPTTTEGSTDAFVLFNESRRPWLDPEVLKSRFLDLSKSCHPDRLPPSASAEERQAASRHYATLNEAYRILRDPKDRLLLLLELEQGTSPRDIQRIPPGTMDLFVEVGQTCRECDDFLQGNAANDQGTSPMLKLQRMQAGFQWTDRLQNLLGRIQDLQRERWSELESMNVIWDKAPPTGKTTAENEQRKAALPLERLEEIYRLASYISRWTEQIQERLVQLAS
jgi:curved DNA-binding protein CbpA